LLTWPCIAIATRPRLFAVFGEPGSAISPSSVLAKETPGYEDHAARSAPASGGSEGSFERRIFFASFAFAFALGGGETATSAFVVSSADPSAFASSDPRETRATKSAYSAFGAPRFGTRVLVCFSKSFTMCDRWSRKWRSARSREVEGGNDVRGNVILQSFDFFTIDAAPVAPRLKKRGWKNFRLERFRDPR